MKRDKQTFKKFAEIIWSLAENFGGTLSDPGIELRFTALKEYELEQISIAATWLLKNRKEKYPPVPTTQEIIEAIETISGGTPLELCGQKQLDIVMRCLKYCGRGCKCPIKDSITRYLMTHRWSMWQLGQMYKDDLKWFRINFVKEYDAIAKNKQGFVRLGNKEKPGTIPIENLKKLLPRGE